MFYAECIDIPGVHIFSKKLHDLSFFLYFDRFTGKGGRRSYMKEELN